MSNVDVLGFALGADACGAAGCHETDVLYHVETPRGDRVLCPAHVLAFPHQLRGDGGGGDPGRSHRAGVRRRRSFKTDAPDARCRNARLNERFRLRRDEPTPALTRWNGIRRGLPVPSRRSGKSVTPPIRWGSTPRSGSGFAPSRTADVDAARRVAAAPRHQMQTLTADGVVRPQSSLITSAYPSRQVMVRSLGGSSEGEGGTPLPLRTPSDRVYHIDANHGAPLLAVVKGVFCCGR